MNASNVQSGLNVVPVEDTLLAFATDRWSVLDASGLRFGNVVDVRWLDSGDGRRFVMPACSMETALGRPSLEDFDETACPACGSVRLFCDACLSLLGSCPKCGIAMNKSKLYDSVNAARSRCDIPKLYYFKHCILSSEESPDLVRSSLSRKLSVPIVFYSEAALDFASKNVGCQILATPVRTVSEAEYRRILTKIGAI